MGEPGRVSAGAVVGRHVLIERIGLGAMGEVWVAIDPDLDRKVAIKLLRPDRMARPEDRARFDTEARLMARLTHPNVVTIHDVGEHDGRLFITMEYVEGETLARWIAAGPHPWREVVEIMRQAAAGLAAAHGVGLVHRDFKPANVMIGRDGRVRVLDFGLARPEGSVQIPEGEPTARSVTLESDDGDSRSRAEGGKRIQGSPAYMSPEQHRGVAVDARSDLFSFCVTLFEALYGVRPFRGNNRLAIALAIVEGRMLEPPAELRARVPDWIHAIVMRGLAGDPGQRFADMDELIAALEVSPEHRRRRRLGIAAAVVGLAGAVGLAFVLAPEPEPDACAKAGAAIAEDWNAEVGSRLRARIDASASAKPLSGQRLVEGIDRHVERWSEASVQLCRDRRARRLTERLQATREACLDERRETLRALVRLANGDDSALVEGLAARPFAGLRALGDPGRCVDRAVGPDRPALAGDQRVARIELELALALLDEPPGEALLAQIEAELDGDPELALLLGRAAASRGDRTDAEAKLHAAAAAATAAEPELAARAWSALLELELERAARGEGRERSAGLERAARLLDYADAVTPEHDLAARAQLGLLAGRLALLEDRGAPPTLLSAALDRLAGEPPREPDLQVALLELRAALDERGGRTSTAASDRARADEIAVASFGRAD